MIALRSIRQKLTAVVMATTLLALLVSMALVIVYDLRSYHQTLVADMQTQAELVGHMTAAALTFDDRRLAGENLALLRTRPQVRAAAIFDNSGKLYASYLAPGELRDFPVAARSDHARVDGDHLLIHKAIVENGERIGTVFLRADYTLLGRALDYLLIGTAVTALTMLLAYLLMRRLGGIVTAPVYAIAEVAREVVATRDYSRRARRTSDDEAAELVDAFNAMLTEIGQRTGALEQSKREVMQLNEQLERRVHERTVQLEMANQELERAMEEARSANTAKSAFLSSMSHELRTPLNAILGFAQILTSDSMPSTLVQKREFAGHILKSGRHLLTLINEILDLAKVESGTVALSMEPVALADIVAEIRTMIEPLAGARQVRVLYPENNGAAVKADRTRLKQVLLNLLSNAVKYNREMGAVVLDCSEAGEDRVRISVQDTGQGLRPDQLDALFQPFNRLGQEGGSEEGTGIGLVVTRRLVELMGGQIGVSSSVGVGSLFWIELQAAPAQAAPAYGDVVRTMARPAPPPGSPHTLLYVEDNPANLKLVQEIISFRSDLRLLVAPDGHLGIEMAKAHLPELILMDLNLPCVSGTDALLELKRDPRTSHIPIIALTANAMPRDVEKGMASGFHRYLTKPINIDEFNAAIDSTLAFIESEARARKA